MINIAICDDEPLALAALSAKIQNYMNEKLLNCTISTFLSGESLLSHISKNKCRFDALYLDIRMNQISGMDAAKLVRETDDQICIVFVTAFKNYVFDAFDVNASNFLLKPIDDGKLASTLDKMRRQLEASDEKILTLCTAGTVEKIPYSSILYCEVLNHRLFVYEKNCMHECAGKINLLEKDLNQDFFRCHRSYIVNLGHVERYSGGFAYMPGAEKIPVATRRQQSFMQALLRFQRNEVR